MSPLFVDPGWYQRRWYPGKPSQPPAPPRLLAWAALAGAVVIGAIVLGGANV
jgi:hypothetical protein